MGDCIFCKIIEGVIPCTKVYEDDQFLAFLDIHPVADGHTLLVPKEHHVWMHETPDAVLADGFVMTKKLMNAMKTGLSCDFVQVSIVGKDVPHFHIHLLPRFFNDGLESWPTHQYKSKEESNAFASKIKNAL